MYLAPQVQPCHIQLLQQDGLALQLLQCVYHPARRRWYGFKSLTQNSCWYRYEAEAKWKSTCVFEIAELAP